MIQFNLLPDVKVQHVKSQRTKRMAILATIIVASASVGILVLLFSYSQLQKNHVKNLDKDITAIENELSSNKELTRILTVQNQLNTLPELYEGRPAAERLPVFLDQTTPATVGIGDLTIDFTLSTVTMSGTADSLEAVNSHVDTLKFTTFKAGEGSEPAYAFTNVVLTSFGRNEDSTSYTIDFAFNPILFDARQNISLIVPTTVTTRAQTTPQDLFSGSTGGAQ